MDIDYKKLSRIADADNFSVKAKGTKEGFEAQIVRKVVRGFEEFMGSVWNCPAKVIVRIEQELD